MCVQLVADAPVFVELVFFQRSRDLIKAQESYSLSELLLSWLHIYYIYIYMYPEKGRERAREKMKELLWFMPAATSSLRPHTLVV